MGLAAIRGACLSGRLDVYPRTAMSQPIAGCLRRATGSQPKLAQLCGFVRKSYFIFL